LANPLEQAGIMIGAALDSGALPFTRKDLETIPAIGSAGAQGFLEGVELIPKVLIDLPAAAGQFVSEKAILPLFFNEEDRVEKAQNSRKFLKQIGIGDERGMVSVSDKLTGARENLFGGGITEAVEKGGPLAGAAAALGFLGGGTALAKLPLIGEYFTGEAFEPAIAKGLGKLGELAPGLSQAVMNAGKKAPVLMQTIMDTARGGAVIGTANTVAEIPFALNEAMDDEGNVDMGKFMGNMGIALGLGAVLGGGGSAIKSLSKSKGAKEYLKQTSDYLKRKTNFYADRPRLDGEGRQLQRVEENTLQNIPDAAPPIDETKVRIVGETDDGLNVIQETSPTILDPEGEIKIAPSGNAVDDYVLQTYLTSLSK